MNEVCFLSLSLFGRFCIVSIDSRLRLRKRGQFFGMETKIREFKENSRYLFSQRISSISSFFLIELSREISPIVANW